MQTIAYLGPEQTNTHLAAKARFRARARYLHAATIDDVFHLVERRQADYGVVPVENSLEGSVAHTLDRFIDFVDTPVRIHGEAELLVHHALITAPKASLSQIRTVYSHPQALAQCRRWLDHHLPRVARTETSSTADAVWMLVQLPAAQRHAVAAIGREELAREHRLRAMPIPDERENKTRFLILGLGEPKRGRRNKTSILFALKDKPGALHDALVPFKHNRINLTKIESRPSKRKAWEYLFFIDVDGHMSEPRLKKALIALERSTSLLRILGSYPVTNK
ncbi:MAG: prephenate dehydratase [Candidatus Omnitrophica bacterium]|nr:prephenate dehydratase [Candidatus Omnitrophota bacterium]